MVDDQSTTCRVGRTRSRYIIPIKHAGHLNMAAPPATQSWSLVQDPALLVWLKSATTTNIIPKHNTVNRIVVDNFCVRAAVSVCTSKVSLKYNWSWLVWRVQDQMRSCNHYFQNPGTSGTPMYQIYQSEAMLLRPWHVSCPALQGNIEPWARMQMALTVSEFGQTMLDP